MAWYAIIFWLWLAVSLVVFVQRRVRGAQRRRGARAAALGRDPRAAVAPTPPGATAVPAAHPAALPHPATHAATHPTAASTLPPELVRAAVATATSPPPPPGLPSIAEIRAMQQRSVLQILTGVRFPCGLYPLTEENGDLTTARRVVAATTGYGAHEVRHELARELARLGFDVRELSAHQFAASGPLGSVQVTVHASPTPFATAPENAVAIEFAVV
jgi:hypothetical protein